MGIFDRTLECPFCVLMADGRSPVWEYLFSIESGNEIISESESFSVILDTAPLAEGHLLIIPDRHVTSLARLPGSERSELREVKDEAAAMLNDAYGPITYFEHGADTFARNAGACVDHAHLHLVPGDVDILPQVAGDYPDIKVFSSYEDALEELAGHAYLMFGRDTGPVYGTPAPVCVTQYLRRTVAQASGAGAVWNWRDCVRWADVLSVRDRLLDARRKLRS